MKTRTLRTCVFALMGPAIGTVAGDSEAHHDDTRPEVTFARRLVGQYARISAVPAPGGGTAYLRETVTIEDTDTPSVVLESFTMEAFFDEALTARVFKYDSKGPCEVVGPSELPGAFGVDCTNDTSFLTAWVMDPGLLQALGFDDCDLVEGEPKDVSNGCAAPTFRFTDCVDQDVFALSEDGSAFQWGDQTQDHCVKRSTALEPEAFNRLDG
jgi:hypothetical protein